MLCSPRTQRTASATFDFPAPFGPTTAVMPVLNSRTVRTAKLLKPSISRCLRYTGSPVFLARAFVHFPDDTIVQHRRRVVPDGQHGLPILAIFPLPPNNVGGVG